MCYVLITVGEVIKIEHLDKSVKDDSPEVMAQQDMRKADYYVSVYTVNYQCRIFAFLFAID